ncbi:MAG: hypothetical protein OXG88_10670 [Gammaproteobacteria bacterium]|nr:hypothetical protein [Gammaproteobacteria bacterium]
MVHNVQTLTSTKHSLVKLVLALHKRRAREEYKRFLIEGLPEITCAAQAHIEIEHVFCLKTAMKNVEIQSIVGRLTDAGTNLHFISRSILARLCYRDSEHNVLAIAKTFRLDLSDLPIHHDSLFLICDRIEKPGNLGAMIRSADSGGVEGVIVCNGITDILHPNTIRNSIGTVFTMPIVTTEFQPLQSWLHKQKIKVVGSSPSASTSYSSVDYTVPTAIVVGSETHGIDSEWFTFADDVVSLPQLGFAESLNAGAAAAIMIFEAHRQKDLQLRGR